MGLRVKEGGAKRWVERAAIASESYVAGAKNPRTPWAQATKDGETNWKNGVAAAATKGSFSKGVTKAGDAAWLKGIEEKGAQRYANGVALAQSKYEAGIAPYLELMKSINLTKRGGKGDAGNYNRVKQLGDALHAKKLALKG